MLGRWIYWPNCRLFSKATCLLCPYQRTCPNWFLGRTQHLSYRRSTSKSSFFRFLYDDHRSSDLYIYTYISHIIIRLFVNYSYFMSRWNRGLFSYHNGCSKAWLTSLLHNAHQHWWCSSSINFLGMKTKVMVTLIEVEVVVWLVGDSGTRFVRLRVTLQHDVMVSPQAYVARVASYPTDDLAWFANTRATTHVTPNALSWMMQTSRWGHSLHWQWKGVKYNHYGYLMH